MAEDRPLSTAVTEYATPAPSLPPSLPVVDSLEAPLEPPRRSFLAPGPSIPSTPRDSRAESTTGPENEKGFTPGHSTSYLPVGHDTEVPSLQPVPKTRPIYRRPVWLAIALGALVAVALGVALPLTLHKSKHAQSNNSGNNKPGSNGTGNGNPNNPSSNAITGGDGSTIVIGDASFVYKNPYGGYWYHDPKNPFNNAARPNSWTPPLNTSWNWATNRVYGVNLGGLFVLEPFITPAFYQKYPNTTDEWTLSQAMAADTGPGGGLQSQLEAHYDTFITEQDFIEMAGAGLNWIRLPIPFWAIEVWPGEPFLPKVCWKYILRVFEWARKYGFRIYLDLHTIPGSQNAFNHSGRLGQVNFLNGIMGIANAQRTLDYIRIITEFISQPEYRELIPLFGIVNEALMTTIGQDVLTSFYLEAHNIIRGITGYGEGNGAYIAIHDAFNMPVWANFPKGSDRIILDTHPYLAFNGQPNTESVVTDDGLGEPGGTWPSRACAWGATVNNSKTNFGVTISGEFSSSWTECGLFLSGTADATTTQGNCATFIDWQNWNQTFKDGVRAFTQAEMDALQNWWFWTWKVGNSSASGKVESPLWSYQLGLRNGWISPDPRTGNGKCQALNAPQAAFAGYSAWQTGGAGAGTVAGSASYPWPPATISGVSGDLYAALPTYTPTGTISTLPSPQLTPSVSEGNGWFNAKDTASAMVTVSGCTYPNAWDSAGAVAPTAACPAGAPPLVSTTAAARTASAAVTTAAAAVTTAAVTTAVAATAAAATTTDAT